MALSNNFYEDIFNKEKYWMTLAKQQFLNIYYLNGKDGLKQFYEKKRIELENECKISNNVIIKNFLEVINNIIFKIEKLTKDYKEGKTIDINSLIPLFLYNQMNNNIEQNFKKEELELIRQQVRNQIEKDRSSYKFEEKYDPEDDAILYREESIDKIR